MGHTNSTANISLPQFIGSDKPTWLGDVNGAFAAIDSKVGTIDADIAATDAKADTAVSDASAAVTTATNANNTAGTASTTATQANNIANNALTAANNADALANQVALRTGTLSSLHTTDKTSIVAAINEVYDEAHPGSVSVTSDGVKTVSALLDELYALIDGTKISARSYLTYSNNVARITDLNSAEYRFSTTHVTASAASSTAYSVKASASVYANIAMNNSGNTVTDYSSTVLPSGRTFEIFY